jgi:multidrug efflux pump
VTALGVIPMALNIEFDFIRREITVGGLGGFWFVHLSAALVSGLFVSTALTLVMVPVMLTAPTVIGASLRRLSGRVGSGLRWVGGSVGGLFGRRQQAVAPEGVSIAEEDGSARQFMTTDGQQPESGESTRQAAE